MSIWNNEYLKHNIEKKYQLTLDEGYTPLEKLILEDHEILIKREDKNPNRSFKDRSIAYQLSYYNKYGDRNFVISSSGNAAISAASYCQLSGMKLDIFISPLIQQNKLDVLEEIEKKSNNIILHISKQAKSDAIKFAQNNGSLNLRGSMDQNAVTGFKTIAYELYKKEPSIDAIFIPCSSGTSTVGIYNGYLDLKNEKLIEEIPQIHIAQTTKIHPIAKEFDKIFDVTKKSLAGAIVDRVAMRKPIVMDIINKTNGNGWIISDEELKIAKGIAINNKIDVPSYNSLLSLAAYFSSLGESTFKKPCLIFSGI